MNDRVVESAAKDAVERQQGRDTAGALAVRHVLTTLRLDEGFTSRMLAMMTEEELAELHDSAGTLAQRVRQHIATRPTSRCGNPRDCRCHHGCDIP
jgi:hypothetical protein